MEQIPRSSYVQDLRCHSIGVACTDCAVQSARWILCVIPADRTTAHAIDVGDNARPFRHISVRAPFIAIVPAWARVELDNDDHPCGLVVALNLAKLRETARKALGTTT